jgi:ascorbate PTS system EIIA or EIIAB component
MLESRSLNTFYQLMSLQPAQLNFFLENIHFSSRQFHYDLKKINYFLIQKGLPAIEVVHDRIIVPKETISFWKKHGTSAMEIDLPATDPEERVIIILLYTFIRQEPLSSFHYQNFLGISKNTVSADMKRVNQFCQDFRVKISYTRENGYHLKGAEEDKRHLMLKAISLLSISPNARGKFRSIFHEHQLNDQFEDYQRVLLNLEKQFSLTFIEERLFDFIYLLQMIHVRQRQNKWVRIFTDTISFLENQEIFKVAEHVQRELGQLPEKEELAFLAIQLLGICQGQISPSSNDALLNITEQILNGFERYASIKLANKEKAIQTLYHHLKPAYYRMLFKIPITNPLLSEIKKEHDYLFTVVKEVMKPIEEVLNLKIPEDEIGFLTLHFGGLLEQSSERRQVENRAVIVCPNGVSSSLMLETQLKSLFPQFHWASSLSTYDFKKMEAEAYDLVFSTVFLETEKPLFILKPVINEAEKKELVQTVKQTIDQQSVRFPTTDELMRVIRQYADIKHPELLREALQNTIYRSNETTIGRKQPVLNDLLTIETIQFEERYDNWKEAIAKVAEPLLLNGSITSKYIDSMIHNIEDLGPYVIVGEEIAIPHSRPENGVNKVGMSLLKLSEPTHLLNEEKNSVKIFICLAAIDNQTHLKALAQLTKLLSDPAKLNDLKAAKTKQDIIDLVSEYSVR